jgi:hypothetical protein
LLKRFVNGFEVSVKQPYGVFIFSPKAKECAGYFCAYDLFLWGASWQWMNFKFIYIFIWRIDFTIFSKYRTPY